MILRRSLSLALLIGLPLATQGQQISMKNMDVYLHIANSQTDFSPRASVIAGQKNPAQKFKLLTPRKTPRPSAQAPEHHPVTRYYASRPIMF